MWKKSRLSQGSCWWAPLMRHNCDQGRNVTWLCLLWSPAPRKELHLYVLPLRCNLVLGTHDKTLTKKWEGKAQHLCMHMDCKLCAGWFRGLPPSWPSSLVTADSESPPSHTSPYPPSSSPLAFLQAMILCYDLETFLLGKTFPWWHLVPNLLLGILKARIISS